MSQNVPPGKKNSEIVLALAAGATVTAAAEAAQLSRKTVQRKLDTPAFRQLVADMRGQFIAGALGRMANNMTRAADALAALLDSQDERVRLRTARAVLSLGLRLRDSVDVTDRVRELERELARKQGAAS
jgi:hypothetical protein